MVIACCDSRVDVNAILGSKVGELFVHRKIANLVPPYIPGKDNHGTAAAVEYAVTTLGVAHIVVLGHSNCGGVEGCYNMCSGSAPNLEQDASFIGRWLDIMRPAYGKVCNHGTRNEQIVALERESIILSLANLFSFPFVKKAVEKRSLSLHGLWNNVGDGSLLFYCEKNSKWKAVD